MPGFCKKCSEMQTWPQSEKWNSYMTTGLVVTSWHQVLLSFLSGNVRQYVKGISAQGNMILGGGDVVGA